MAEFDDDHEFSSGSSDSSIDPSQLAGDWKLNDEGVGKLSTSVALSVNEEGVTNSVRTASNDGDVDHDESQSRTEDDNPNQKIKIVMGDSVLEWQRRTRNLESGASESPSSRAPMSDYVTLRDNQSAIREPLSNAAKLSLSNLATATITTKDDKEYTGKYTSQSCSTDTSATQYVECVAVYDEHRKAHVLEVVDWTVSNLKPASEPPPSSVAIASDPRQEQQKAEERVKSKRKRKADGGSSSSAPRKKKLPSKQAAKSSPAIASEGPAANPTATASEIPNVHYRGVTAIKRSTGVAFRAQITFDGKPKYLGMFSTAEEAARRYDQEARKKTKNVRLNFPDEATPVAAAKEQARTDVKDDSNKSQSSP